MSYTIDVFRGEVKATRNLIDFACFVTLFPHLIAGPIVRYQAIADQLVERHLRLESVSYGAQRFIVGLGKKVLIANTVALAADQIFSLPPGQFTTGLAWLGVCCYTLQIYFDFSGYSDMAIGMGRMLGFTILENFSIPLRRFFNPGILAPLAYLALDLVSRLSVQTSWREVGVPFRGPTAICSLFFFCVVFGTAHSGRLSSGASITVSSSLWSAWD